MAAEATSSSPASHQYGEWFRAPFVSCCHERIATRSSVACFWASAMSVIRRRTRAAVSAGSGLSSGRRGRGRTPAAARRCNALVRSPFTPHPAVAPRPRCGGAGRPHVQIPVRVPQDQPPRSADRAPGPFHFRAQPKMPTIHCPASSSGAGCAESAAQAVPSPLRISPNRSSPARLITNISSIPASALSWASA
jgi:hypothetical protein